MQQSKKIASDMRIAYKKYRQEVRDGKGMYNNSVNWFDYKWAAFDLNKERYGIRIQQR